MRGSAAVRVGAALGWRGKPRIITRAPVCKTAPTKLATPARRDWLLGGVGVEIGPDGTVAPPAGPGLGVVPDLDALEAHRIA